MSSAAHMMKTLSPPRPLTANEREVLRLLVGAIDADPEVLDCQTSFATVVEECSGHCGTVILAVEEGACAPVDIERGAPATADGIDKDGGTLSVLLHFRDGYIRMLEIVKHDGSEANGLPVAGSLSAYGGSSRSPWRD